MALNQIKNLSKYLRIFGHSSAPYTTTRNLFRKKADTSLHKSSSDLSPSTVESRIGYMMFYVEITQHNQRT